MLNAIRPRGLIVRLCSIAAIALALFVAAMSRAPSGETASGPDVLSSVTVGPWQVIATRDTGSGPHCVARRQLGASGTDRPHTIEFLRGRGQETLRLTADAWTLPRDTILPVTLAAGERVRGRSEAMLFTPTQLSIAAGDLLTVLERIAAEPAIEVRISGHTLTLSLSDVTAMRSALEACIVERLGSQFGSLTVQLPVWPPDADLVEEHRFLTVRIGGEDYRLDTLVVRPAGARGRLPIALIGHGQDPRREMSILSMVHLQRQARDLAHRGYLAVAVIRRGFGQSDGVPGLPGGGAYGRCGTHAERLFDAAADDLAATLAVIAERPTPTPAASSSASPPPVPPCSRSRRAGFPGCAPWCSFQAGWPAGAEMIRSPTRARRRTGSRLCWRQYGGRSRCRRSGSMPTTTACSQSRWRARCTRSMPAAARRRIS